MNEQVSHGVSNIVLPLPKPPRRKGGGTKGGKQSYLRSLFRQPLRLYRILKSINSHIFIRVYLRLSAFNYT